MKVFMLGGNDSSAVSTFTEVTMGDLLPEQLRVKHIACGRHFVVVTEDDQVYVYGDNSSQQLSLSTIKPTKNKFAKIEGPWGSRRITHLRCSNYATAIATHSHLYMVGDNRNGQCGRSPPDLSQFQGVFQAENQKEITIVAMGYLHTIILVDQSEIYCTGYNNNGQLALPDKGERHAFTRCNPQGHVLYNQNVKQIACGDEHSIVLCENNQLYGFGLNRDKQLGIDADGVGVHSIPFPYSIREVQCGWHHTILLGVDGDAWHCGEFPFNLENIRGTSISRFPPLPDSSMRLVSISKQSPGKHSMFLTADNRIFASGVADYGNMGTNYKSPGGWVEIPFPEDLNRDEGVKFLASGYSTAMIVVDRIATLKVVRHFKFSDVDILTVS